MSPRFATLSDARAARARAWRAAARQEIDEPALYAILTAARAYGHELYSDRPLREGRYRVKGDLRP